MNMEPGSLTVKLRKMNTLNQYQVRGTALGLPIQNGDDQIDFGLVMPAFTKMQLFSFNIYSIISSQSDVISAMEQDIPIPANLSLPKQSEKLRSSLSTWTNPLTVFALANRASNASSWPKVVCLRGGKQFWELINSSKTSSGAPLPTLW